MNFIAKFFIMQLFSLLFLVAESIHLVGPAQQLRSELKDVSSGFKDHFSRVVEELDASLVELEQRVTVKKTLTKKDMDMDESQHLARISSSKMSLQDRIDAKAEWRAVYRQAVHTERQYKRTLAEIQAGEPVSARQSLNGLKAALRHF